MIESGLFVWFFGGSLKTRLEIKESLLSGFSVEIFIVHADVILEHAMGEEIYVVES